MKSLDFRGAWLTPLLTLLGAMVAGMLYAGVALAAPVNEVEPNNSSAAAQNIDGSFTLDQDPDIGDATTNTSTTMPHATVEGTGDDSFDYYSFTVTQAGARGIFDIDYAGVCDSDSFLAGFDAFLTLHDSNGNLPDFNDDAFSDPPVGQGGSVCGFDSYFEHTFATPGTYYIEVSSCCGLPEPHPVPAVGFDGAATSYKLQVSLSGVALAQGGADVCVSNKGETKVQKGDSTCSSDSTSHQWPTTTAERSHSITARPRPTTTASRSRRITARPRPTTTAARARPLTARPRPKTTATRSQPITARLRPTTTAQRPHSITAPPKPTTAKRRFAPRTIALQNAATLGGPRRLVE